MKEYRKLYVKVILLSIPAIILGTGIPFLVSYIVDSIINGKTEGLAPYLAAFLGLLLLNKLTDLFSNYHFNMLARTVTANEREKFAEKFLFSKSNLYGRYSEEKIINRMLKEVTALGIIYGEAPAMLILNILMLIVYFIVLAVINIRLLIVSCLIIPLVYVCGNILKKRIIAASEAETLAHEKLLHRITELVRGFCDIKLFKAERNILNTLHKTNLDFLNAQKKVVFADRLYHDIADIIFSVLPLLCMIIGFWLSTIHQSTLGSVVSFYMYVPYFIEPINTLTNLRSNMLSARKKNELIAELEQDFLTQLSGSEPLAHAETVTVENINHNYGKTVITSDQKFNIAENGLYGISAVSGAGKTTILKIISGFLASPDSSVFLSGKDIRTLNTDDINDAVCYVSDKSFIFEGSVKENIELSPKLAFNDAALSFLFDADEHITAETLLESEGKNISLGQKQRIIMLRLFSLVKKPDVLILDEALSGTDEKRESAILQEIKKHFNRSKILFVTHRSSSFDFCDFMIRL